MGLNLKKLGKKDKGAQSEQKANPKGEKRSLKEKASAKYAEHQEKTRAKWRAEVDVEGSEKVFKDLDGWKSQYIKTKDEGEGKESSFKKQLYDKALDKISGSVSGNILRGCLTASADMMDATYDALNKEIFGFVNSLSGFSKAYIFEKKAGKKKMLYIRGISADRFAISQLRGIDAQAEKLGIDPISLDPESSEYNSDNAEKVMNAVIDGFIAPMEEQKDDAIAQLKKLVIQGTDDANVNDNQIDMGMQLLIKFMEHELNKLIPQFIVRIKVVLPQMFSLTQGSRKLIIEYNNMKSSGENESQAYAAFRDQLVGKIDEEYKYLLSKLKTYIKDVFAMLGGGGDDDDEDD